MYELNIIKKIKKNYKNQLLKDTKIFLRRKLKKPQYGCERYKNLSEDEKQELVEYRKKILQNEKKTLDYNFEKVF